MLVPLLALGVVEGGLRLLRPQGGLQLFVPAEFAGEGYVAANRLVARRYFPGEEYPPAPPIEPFKAARAEGALRVFVLGESSAAGFPLPHNGTFSRVLADVLADVLPDATIEMVNLGIAATNSFTLVDLMDEVLEQRPDLVLVYGGHNEYYGALGVGSRQGAMASPSVKRMALRVLRLRTAVVLRDALASLLGGEGGAASSRAEAATMMEVVARDQEIELGSDVYKAGLQQFAENIALVIQRCREQGVPVFVASQPSNVLDRAPFASAANGRAGGADSVFASASHLLATGDSSAARELFIRARDLDVVRFRAPSKLNEVVRRVAAEQHARYVPVAEAFDARSGGMPGTELFFEHVHPTPSGQVLIARTFFESIRDVGLDGWTLWLDRLRPWDDYEERMALTYFDRRVAEHAVATLTTQWPFVPVDEKRDYRATARPVDLADSLALVVSRGGMAWGAAKLELAANFEARGKPGLAAAEYRGLARDAPFAELPHRLLGRALLAAGDSTSAREVLERAFELEATGYSGTILGRMAVERQDYHAATRYLEAAARDAPSDPVALYSLSLAYGMSGDMARARATAELLKRLAPSFPGQAEWRQTLGIPP